MKLNSRILSALKNVQDKGNGEYVADCPFCGKSAKEQKFFFNFHKGTYICHSGKCNERGGLVKLANQLGIEIRAPRIRSESSYPHSKNSEWVYHDSDGKPVLRVTRVDKDGKKSYYQNHYKDGGWAKGAGGHRAYLYQLPCVLKAKVVFMVEGEKAADALNAEFRKSGMRSYCATTNLRGAHNRYWSNNNEHLAGKQIYILPDNDDEKNDNVGQRYALHILRELTEELRANAKIVDLGLKQPKEDIVEWLTLPGYAGNAKKLVQMAETQPGKIPDTEAFHKIEQEAKKQEQEEQEEESERGELQVVLDRLNAAYDFRYNAVKLTPEFRKKGAKNFLSVEEKHENTVLIRYNLTYRQPRLNASTLATFLASDYVADYHPFRDYFASLPEWDGKDYIEQLAKTLKTEEKPEEWYKFLKMWLVGIIATATWAGHSQIMLTLVGAQGDGKSKWLERLIPEVLQPYGSSSRINFNEKDGFQFLTNMFMIRLDEFDQYRGKEPAMIKDFVSQSTATFRPPYGRRPGRFPRSASFCATSNNMDFLTDMTGNRRFLIYNVSNVDYLHGVNIDMVYSQAQALFKAGERYWLDKEEIHVINDANENYRQRSMEEDLLQTHFMLAAEGDLNLQYMMTGEILMRLKDITGIVLSQNQLGRALTKAGFQRTSIHITGKGSLKKWMVREVNHV